MSAFLSLKKQHGFLTLITILLIVIIGFVGIAVTYMLVGSASATSSFTQSEKAFYIAEAGLEKATRFLSTPIVAGTNLRTACSAITGTANLTNSTMGTGAFTVTMVSGSPVSADNNLSSAITSAAVTISVTSATGFATSGRIVIDKEFINYGAISGNSFIGVTRGVDGTTASTHASGAPVDQYQCNINSTGGVPNVTSALFKRTLQQGVQLQQAWVVGNRVNPNATFLRWNRPTEMAWSSGGFASTLAYNGVSMVSYSDGWAVGAGTSFRRWDGSNWNSVTVAPNVTYQKVFCNASNDCHAVGASNAGRQTILDWNGTSWTRPTVSGLNTANNLTAIHCSASNDCWAVGNAAGTDTFYQWNGSVWTGINVTGLSAFTYNAVFCNSSTDCWAVGSGSAAFARKNGATWANFATGLPSSTYNGIFCNSSSDCWAVGNVQGGRDLIVHWNGTAWARDASVPTPNANLTAVACANANDCWAIGANSAFVHWNGSTWAQFTTSGLPSTALNSISIIAPNTQPQAAWQEIFP